MLYFGTYERNLDDKGRLQLPPKLIGQGNPPYTLVKGFSGCISIYDKDGFDKLLERLSDLDMLDPDTVDFVRLTTESITPLKYDPHGRILFGKDILKAYGINSKVTIIGVLDHFEVWDTEAYVRYSVSKSFQYEALAKGVKHRG